MTIAPISPPFLTPNLIFTPVPLRPRRDGWTPSRQRAFIAALARTGRVVRAAQAVGLSVRSAYRLWHRPGADGLRAAWRMAIDAARELRYGAARLAQRHVASVWTHPPEPPRLITPHPSPLPVADRVAYFLARQKGHPLHAALAARLIAAFRVTDPATKRTNGRREFRDLPETVGDPAGNQRDNKNQSRSP